jgi:hypothetical protein
VPMPFGAEVKDTKRPTGCIAYRLNIYDCLWRCVGWLMHVFFGVAVSSIIGIPCQTAFQDGRAVARAIRKGRRTAYIKDNGKLQRRYIRRPTGIGRFLRPHGVSHAS